MSGILLKPFPYQKRVHLNYAQSRMEGAIEFRCSQISRRKLGYAGCMAFYSPRLTQIAQLNTELSQLRARVPWQPFEKTAR